MTPLILATGLLLSFGAGYGIHGRVHRADSASELASAQVAIAELRRDIACLPLAIYPATPAGRGSRTSTGTAGAASRRLSSVATSTRELVRMNVAETVTTMSCSTTA